MNTAAKGARLERQVRDVLLAAGYFVVKAGGSKGPADLVAVRRDGTLFVQVKAGTGRMRPPEWNLLLGLGQEFGAVPVLAEREDRGPLCWWALTGRKAEGGRPGRAGPPCYPFDPGPVRVIGA